MASKPNPSWTEPQKKIHSQIFEGADIVIPYFGDEIPRLDNHTDEQLCDMVGVVKKGKKAFENVEKILVQRFKARLGQRRELRGHKYEATIRGDGGGRTILNQSKCKELLEKADELGVDLLGYLEAVEQDIVAIDTPLGEDSPTNMEAFHTSSGGDALYVEPIA